MMPFVWNAAEPSEIGNAGQAPRPARTAISRRGSRQARGRFVSIVVHFRTGQPMTTQSLYDRDLGRHPANYAPLTPLSLIARTAYTWPQRIAVVHGERRYTWGETYAR